WWFRLLRLLHSTHQLLVPGFTVLPDQRLLQKFVKGNLKLPTESAGRRTDVPFMVVHSLESFLFRDADRIQMAADGFAKRNFPILVSLFYGTLQNAFFIIMGIHTFPPLDNGCRVIAFRIYDVGALGFYGLYAFLRQVRLYLRIDISQNGKLFHFQRCAVIAFHAARTLALFKVADELPVANFI